MRQRAQFVDGFEGAPALDAVFPAYEEQNSCADEHDRADAGLEGLNEISVIIELKLMNAHQHQ